MAAKSTRRIIFIALALGVLLALALGSRSIFAVHQEWPPLVSGVVFDGGLYLGQFTRKLENGQPAKSWPLSEVQLQKLYSWLQSHKSGWTMVVATPPPPSFSILLVHSDGTRTQLDLYSQNESWQRAIGFIRFDGDGHFLRRGQMSRTADEVSHLKALLSD
jgi:hypothetical protein